MAAAGSALVIMAMGMAVLAAGRIAPSDGERVGVVLPPWQEDSLARLAAADVPILSLRAGGLVAVVAADDAARLRLSAAGLVLVAARAEGLCVEAPVKRGT